MKASWKTQIEQYIWTYPDSPLVIALSIEASSLGTCDICLSLAPLPFQERSSGILLGHIDQSRCSLVVLELLMTCMLGGHPNYLRRLASSGRRFGSTEGGSAKCAVQKGVADAGKMDYA